MRTEPTHTRAIPEVSVVVPVYNNQHDLNLVLAGLSVQTHPLSRLQVVLADDGSDVAPSIPDVARGLDICVVRQPDAGFRAGLARNLGARHCDGAVILFLDGDTVPTPRYVENLAALPGVLADAVVSGRRRYADLSGWTDADLLTWFAGRTAALTEWDEPAWLTDEYVRSGNLRSSHPRSYKYLIGAVLGCSREMFDEIDGFDQTITGYGGEDYDFTYRAYNAGAIFAHVPQAQAWHDGPEWSRRTDPKTQTAQKNREVMMLAERIPEPSMRGRGQRYPVVDVVVTVDPGDWSLGAGVLCVRSLLEALDCGIWICGRGASSVALAAVFGGDQRVHARPPDPVSDKRAIDRARLRIDVTAAFIAGREFAAAVTDMLEQDTGTFTMRSNHVVVATGRSSRSERRQRRHLHTERAADELAFPHRELDSDECGVEVVRAEPGLAAVFGGYAQPASLRG